MPVDAQGMAHSSNSVPGEKSVGHKTDNSTVPRQSRQSQWDMRLGQSHTHNTERFCQNDLVRTFSVIMGGEGGGHTKNITYVLQSCSVPPQKNTRQHHFNLSSHEEQISFKRKVFLT